MSGAQHLVVEPGDEGIRLDRWFKRHFPNITHARLGKWLRTGQVRLDGGRIKAGARVAAGQDIRVPPLGEEAATPKPRPRAPKVDAARAEALLSSVIYRDDQVIAIDKPPGLAVQGGTGTLRHVDGMLDLLRFGARQRPRLVHRLDKDTSGVLLLARTAAAAARLGAAFRSREALKVYWALVAGVPRPAQGTIDLALAKMPGARGEKVVADAEAGKRAMTRYRIVDRAGGKVAWLALSPLTGRTHQLRAHCAAMGTPILGDGKYGGAEAFLAGDTGIRAPHLHARAIRLPHPGGGVLEVLAPLPAHMRATWQFMGFEENDEQDPFAGFEER